MSSNQERDSERGHVVQKKDHFERQNFVTRLPRDDDKQDSDNQARTFDTTFPWTSVKRKSRP